MSTTDLRKTDVVWVQAVTIQAHHIPTNGAGYTGSSYGRLHTMFVAAGLAEE